MKKFAFVFPGQGSQAVGMLDAWGDHPAVRQAVQEASDALGEDLGALIAQGPKEALALTTNTQPVMLLAGVAAWRVWQAEGGALPDAVAGHSLGNIPPWSPLGVKPGQAIPLVRLRAAVDAGGGAGGCRCHGCGIGVGRRQGQSRCAPKSRPIWAALRLWKQ